MRTKPISDTTTMPLSRRSFAALAVPGLAGLLAAPRPSVAQLAAPVKITDGYEVEKLDGVTFGKPTQITNKWLPIKPGKRYTYEGTTVEDDGKLVPHKIVINTTDLVKVIGGITNVVSYDLDYSNHELVEVELAFFSQDDVGNVWYFGEYPEEYEDNRFQRAPTWIHGFEGAHAGIVMQAMPRLGMPSYAQGYGPAVDWTDRATIHQTGLDVTVRHGRYKDVLVVRETSRSEVDAFQLKYYAEGVGKIKVGWLGAGEKSKETLELTKIEQLSPKELAAVRSKALALEKSAYRRSKTVYAHTEPSKVMVDSRGIAARKA